MDIVVDEALVDKIASLARLDLAPEERKALLESLRRILEYVRQIGALPLEGVEPALSGLDGRCPLREDAGLPSLPREALIRSAPDAAGGFFKVPKIIDAEAPEV
ncbi:MAG: Asp-tRNA(Asn)/Glu-tRNA(Gln) amidotransferase subunit GatC [Planctomycetes bacterium]|jgi:aspartyl-tRNA(Asn)/glutamyl-tRNA(Gln) amidotransferase subunit C|nr:Asp-tRNA(Asn)/Glu-tRNA(Gln) amidotransferase subunit GatC [Planctomycetota bacterium]